ncbi:MAG TPA: peptidylprolyl isomerase [Pseudonocardiaceae bacterium]|nr:peptidylprolyl isomerase [Pseudonocardiaceae bacterium]
MRRPRIRAVIGLFGPVAALVVLAGCTVTVVGDPAPATVAFSSGPCRYAVAPDEPAPQGKAFGLPADPSPTPKTGTVTVTLRTSQGPIPLTLNRAQAPCTVQSFLFLARKTFFDNTPCHRLTADPMLMVLQCGDPTGSGEGGPGYTIPDENPTGFAPAPPGPPGTPPSVIYPTGTVAMANTGQPHSGGSQFFLVYGDSQLPPAYAVFGTVDAAGLTTLSTVAAGGIAPGMNAQDGKPRLPVTISAVTVSS